MKLLRGIAVALGWLSGSLAGIGAVVYACGYLITRAQLHLFGVSGFFPLSADHFMQEGAKFLVVIGQRAIETLLGVVAFALVVLAVFLVVWLPLMRWLPSLRLDLVNARARVMAAVARIHERLPWSPAFSIYLVLLVLLVWLLETYRTRFAAPLEVSNILHLTLPPPAGDSAERRITGWLLAEDWRRLEMYFTDLLDAETRVILLLIAAWHVSAALARRVALLTPFVIALALYTLYLPMAYGVLMRPTSYNIVMLHFRERSTEPPALFFLLSNTDQEFVVWDANVRTVLWVPKGEVIRAEVHRVQSLFAKKGLTP
jgi:hypothetical protein